MNLPLNRILWPPRWKQEFEERAAIIEYDARLPRATAEGLAEIEIRERAAKEKMA